jgi:hypothetical protein
MSLHPRATVIVACAAAAAALATTSTAAESWPSGGVSLTAGGSPTQPDPASSAAPVGGTVPTGAAPLTGGTTAMIAPALPAPIHRELAQSIGPSGGVALLPLAHIAARLPLARGSGTRKTWTIRVDGRELSFNQLSRR